MTMNLFEFVDLDAPVPIVVGVAPARESFVIQGRLTPAEAEQARRLVPVSRGYLHPTEGSVSGGWPA